MYRFDMYCRKCNYEGEVILNHHSDRADCPICHNALEKAAGGFNISTSKTRRDEEKCAGLPNEIGTPFGRFKLSKSWKISLNENHDLEIGKYDKRNPALGDPEMN